MALYNVLNERDYYPRKGLPDLNPHYPPRKQSINEELAVVALMSNLRQAARQWIGSAFFLLDHPKAGEEELFLAAAEELERMAEEVRRG